MPTPTENLQLLPRLIRHRDAPFYLGMDKNRFNQEVRPQIQALRIGKQGIAFDRLDLDAWVEHYKARNERPTSSLRGVEIWDKKVPQAFAIVTGSGTLKNRSTDKRFAQALERVTSKKRS